MSARRANSLAMKITGNYTLHGPREYVWPLIQDPASLVRLIPGCEQLKQVSPTEYRGQMQIPVAAVAGAYTMYVRLLEECELYLTRFEGEMAGPAGVATGEGAFRLLAEEDRSRLVYEGQAIITGPLGRMDGRFTEGVAYTLIQQGLANLDRQLQATTQPVPAPASPNSDINGRPSTWIATAKRLVSKLAAQIRASFMPGTAARRARSGDRPEQP